MTAIELLEKELSNCKTFADLKLYNAKRVFALNLELVTFNEVELMEFEVKEKMKMKDIDLRKTSF